MAPHSLKRENAKQFLSAERLPLPGHFWPEYFVQGPYLVNPEGYGIHRDTLYDLEALLHMHRLIGYFSDWIPYHRSRNPYDITYQDERIAKTMAKLNDMLERQN